MEDVSNLWVWLLGGGQMQTVMANEIKRRGYKLLITDLNPNCICRPLADRFEQVDIYNAQMNLVLAKKLEFRPVAVLTVATDAGIEVSTLADYFGLPAAPNQVAKQVRNKAMMRGLLKDLSPKFRAGVTMAHFADWDTFPCVVKAADNSGSKGFSVVRSREELHPALVRARKSNRYGINTVLVEEYLEPVDTMPELTDFSTAEAAVEGFFVNSIWFPANGALRLFHRQHPGIEAGHFNPFIPDAKTVAMLNDAAWKLGVSEGPLKFDLMHTKDGWRILECATRLSGGYDHFATCPLATGKDITGFMLDYSLGFYYDYDKLVPTKDRHACCYAPILPPGKLSGWIIPREATQEATHIFTNDKNGEIRPLESNADRPLFIIADGATREEALEKCLRVAGMVKPLYVES